MITDGGRQVKVVAAYRDNRCTATQQLAGPSLRPLESTKEFLPDWLPVDEQAGFVGYLMFFGSLAAALGLSVIVGRKIIRRIARRGA